MPQSSATISVVIADADREELARTRALLQQDHRIQVEATAAERNEVLLLLDREPDIFLLAANIDPRETTTLVKQLLELAPSTQVLLLADDTDAPDMRRAVLAGARGILRKPLTAEELLGTILEVFESDVARRERIAELARQRKAKSTRGRVIVIFSPKGGVGCTVLACNLAIALRRLTNKRVALIDYSLQFGTIGTQLNIQSAHSVAELAPHEEDLDNTILDDVMVQHTSGIRVLLPPNSPEQVEMITTESLTGILEGLRSHFDYIVVDTWHSVEDATLAIMESADNLLLVTTPEVPALSTARRFLDMLKRYPQLLYKPQLVVNRHPSKGGVALAEIEKSIGLQAIATIPSDGSVMTLAINEGIPVFEKSTTSVAVRNLSKLAETLALPADIQSPIAAGNSHWLGALRRRGFQQP
jgi:pilus assembly protein CpaE